MMRRKRLEQIVDKIITIVGKTNLLCFSATIEGDGCSARVMRPRASRTKRLHTFAPFGATLPELLHRPTPAG
jgi:hypothetical protein